MLPSNKIWAVVAGLDHYPDPADWLYGAAGDALRVRDFLIKNLQVAEDHIDLLLLPHPGNEPAGLSYREPSCTKILNSLADTRLKAQPGDTVWFYFAGHGCRVKTQYPDKKQDTGLDEVICASDGDVADIQLDEALARFVQQGVQALAIFDSCHSGGATRHGGGKRIRCRTKSPKELLDEAQAASRNTKVRETWFYQHRKYHLIAACQPFQQAHEVTIDGILQGMLTQALLDIFCACSDVRRMPFKTVQQRLDVKFSRSILQNPLVLGSGDATIGGNSFTPYITPSTVVSAVGQSSITLDKGAASGTNVGDVYELLAPADYSDSAAAPTALMTVTVSFVGGSESICQSEDPSTSLVVVKPGYVARLLRRASTVTIAILEVPENPPPLRASREVFIKNLASNATNFLPFYFYDTIAASPSGQADYCVAFAHDGHLEIYDTKFQLLQPVPCIQHDDKHLINKFLSVLQKVHDFRKLRDLRPSAADYKPSYDFQILDSKPDSDLKDAKARPSKQVYFRNLGASTQFVTILNLTPAFGVYQVYPYDDAQSIAVEPGNELPHKLIVDIELPAILSVSAAPRLVEARDILKVFITSRQQSFEHYLQNEFESVGDGRTDTYRRARPRALKPFEWWCDQLDIVTPL